MSKVVKTVVKAAVIAAAVATGVGVLVGSVAVGAAGAYFATTFVTSLVLGGVSAALTKSPSTPSITLQDQTVTSRQPIAPHVVVYGRTRLGGTILYMESTESNKFLHMVIALTGHEIDAVESVYFGDEQVTFDGSGNVTTGKYANKARIEYKLGTTDQTAFSNLVSESDGKWTANHRVRGRALLYVRFEYDQNVYFNGVPNVSAVIRGKKVYDPRTDTTVWSANPALCLADYLTNTKYGVGADYATEIDETALAAAANICDEDVLIIDLTYENRYETHGAFATSSKPEDVINQIVSSMAGKCIWSNGTWRILAGAYYAPTLSFDENDLRGGFRVQSLVSRRESFNGVKGVFLAQKDNYVITDFPSIVSATYKAQDNNEERLKSIELPMTTSHSMAQRLAKIELLRARQQITTSLPMKLVGLKANVGDIVQINNSRMGWSNKPFEVVSSQLTFSDTVGVDLELREVASNVYDWSVDEEQALDPAPNTNLPNAFTVGTIESLVAESGTDILQIANDGTIISRIKLTWDTISDQFVISGGRVEVQYKPATESVYSSQIVDGASTSAFVGIVEDGKSYNLRVRAISALGIQGAWTTTTHTVIGKTTPPADPTGFAIDPYDVELKFTWNENTEPDFSYYEIRTEDANWGSDTAALVFRGKTNSCFVPPNGVGTLTYYIKSVDTSGNYSTGTDSDSYTVVAPTDITAINEVFSDTSLTSAEILLAWDDVTTAFGVAYYQISYNSTTVNIKSNSVSLPANWIGSRTFTVTVHDNIGNSSAGFSKSITKLAPNPITNLRAQVIDNNVLLYWDLPSRTTLPLSHALLKKGASWATATTIGRKDGGFTSLQETQAGTYQYWVAVVDTDDNESEPTSIAVQVAEPPDFIFHGEFTSDFSATKSSALQEDHYLVMPVNLTETFQEHFDDNSWSTPQDQIDAGYPIYIQPANGTGYYEEVFDFGTELASSKITVNYAGTVVAGTPHVDFTISYSEDGVSYINLTGVTEAFATNFRYIKIKVTVTEDDGLGIYKLTYLNVRLDAKQRSDSGSVSCVSTDTDGTLVNFNKEFIDVTSINISASGTTPLTTVYDFQDANLSATYAVVSNVCTVTSTSHGLIAGQNVRLAFSTGNGIDGVYTIASATTNTFTVAMVVANTSGNCLVYPEGFRVYLFNSSGTRVNGVVSWSIKGY